MLGTAIAFLTLMAFSHTGQCYKHKHAHYSGEFHTRGGRYWIIEDPFAGQGSRETLIDFGEEVGVPQDCRQECDGENCDLKGSDSAHLTCFDWVVEGSKTSTSLRVTAMKTAEKSNYSKISTVASHSAGKTLSLCFPLEGESLYGGPSGGAYPSQYITKNQAPYVTGEDSSDAKKSTGPVAERKWLTSGGRAIHVKSGSPLFVSQNTSMLCLYVMNKSPYPANATIQLEYDECLTENVKEAWKCLNDGNLHYRIPPQYEYIVREPIWSTWVAFKANISQQIVLDFASSIKKHQLRMGVMEVDDKWETCYGSHKFDPTTFPEPKKMIDELHRTGAKVTFWVHPFVNTNCTEFEGYEEHLFKVSNGSVGITTWWEGQAGLLNFLQKDTRKFFTKILKGIKKEYGADGFKFDAGEAYWIPALFEETPLMNPNEYTTAYAKMAEGFGPATEVRSGADDTTSLDLFLRILDTNTDWSLENHGIKSVLAATLQLSAMGYRAIMPDMIGGNCYGETLDKELFIRWVQLTAFLPVMQFSYPPWYFDDETVDITRSYIELHYKYSDFILKSLKAKDTPLIAPIWWLDPTSSKALNIYDEFLVGDGNDWILVAPVVEKGATSREIYLPPGNWTDGNNQETIEGPVTILDYPAPLQTLPYFKSFSTETKSCPEQVTVEQIFDVE